MSKIKTVYAPDRPVRPLGFPRRARWVCERMAAGEGLDAICARPDMPRAATVYRWLAQSAEFRRRYALARRVLAERWIDQVVDIADRVGPDAKEADLRLGRLRIDARKWAVAQLAEEAAETPAAPAGAAPLKVTFVDADA